MLIQGGAKKYPAFKLWEDDYLKSHKEAETFEVFVENRKKENRTNGGNYITLKKFIETYHKDDIYMVNGVPDHLQYVCILEAMYLNYTEMRSVEEIQ